MKLIRSIFFALAAVLSFIFAILCFDSSGDGVWPEYESYGGDAFTGIQHAAARTSLNAKIINKNNQKAFAYLFLVGGVALLGCAVPNKETIESFKNKKPSEAEVKPGDEGVS